MNVLLLGSGGREHALAWKLVQSPLLSQLYTMPGNPGTAGLGVNLEGDPSEFKRIREIADEFEIGMVVVGPEDPLVRGISDQLKADPATAHIVVIGPGAVGAQLEGSKAFAKAFMMRHGIPTARYCAFGAGEFDQAVGFLGTLTPPYVLKADGLAAGKGVVIHEDFSEAVSDLRAILLEGKFGQAGNTVVIEEFLKGIEVSVFVLTDGKDYVVLPEAKDYKRIGEGDTGLNTGGMGSVSPVSFYSSELGRKVEEKVIKPTISGLRGEQIDYTGFIFFGLMIVDGDPFVIEYNVRMGDPETESVMPRIEGDLLQLFQDLGEGRLSGCHLDFSPEHAATVILVSEGYPGDYERGFEMAIPETRPETLIFHAGTRYSGDKLVTNGGRVLAITSLGSDMKSALSKSYKMAGLVDYKGRVFRRDIGFDL